MLMQGYYTMAASTDYSLSIGLIITGVILVAALVIARRAGHRLALPQEASAIAMLCLGLLSTGAAGRIDVESLAAATVATVIRFLLPNRTPIRSVIAAFLASGALAIWGVPLLMAAWHMADGWRPVIAFAGGLFSLNLVRFALEDGWEMFKKGLSVRIAAMVPQPKPEGGEE